MTGRAAAQLEVRRTMLDAGGYWRPLAAVARLLEELGELLELLAAKPTEDGDLAGELADLWIITAALADQFLIELAEPGSARPQGGGEIDASRLVIAAGPIARIINHYDGPKAPRVPGELPSLSAAIGSFQAELARLSAGAGVDLAGAVANKLGVIRRGGDMSRFAHESTDPSTAAVLGLLGPGGGARRLWGTPGPSTSAQALEHARALAPSLRSFARAARAERLDGFVIGAPDPPGSAALESWIASLLGELRRLEGQPGDIDEVGPRGLRFEGLELLVSVLPAEAGPAPPPEAQARSLVLLSPRDGGVLAGPTDDRA